ncbi:unnamed protein product [Candidatus Paraburkholderia kirkii UZHbot1]|uniref:WGS project CAFE00000000 data, contig bkir_c67 n=1 Tax=Candidatus Paraburkholderia kirkii UZHbot1 TaxID=1055526 RepID=U3UB23_9BURK|nr:unnamed protein product [Candidatus Paraburkholderia kirkii UZHbot1]
MMREPLLKLKHVTRRFRSGARDLTVLPEMTLSIHKGEFVAIVGPSGSGKSTLMQLLGCLDRADSGSYRIDGREVQTLSADDLARLRRERFGFVFQRYHLIAHLGALENIEVPAIYRGIRREPRRAHALDLLARLGLTDRANHLPGALSGGQQQRVSIARALMNGADIILADEPTGALDSESGRDVLTILRELNAQGRTSILVTHDMQVAASTHRIVEIREGRIVGDRIVAERSGQARLSSPGPFVARPSQSTQRGFPASRMAWRALFARKLRTLLTMLGVVIGIASVLSVVGIGESTRRDVARQVTSLGPNTIDVYPGKDWGDSQASSIKTLVPSDAELLQRQSYVDSVTTETRCAVLLRYRNVDANAQAGGVGEYFLRVHGIELTAGAFFGSRDVQR